MIRVYWSPKGDLVTRFVYHSHSTHYHRSHQSYPPHHHHRYKRINRYKHDTFHFEVVQEEGGGYHLEDIYGGYNGNEGDSMSSPGPKGGSTIAVGGRMVKGASNLMSIIGGNSRGAGMCICVCVCMYVCVRVYVYMCMYIIGEIAGRP